MSKSYPFYSLIISETTPKLEHHDAPTSLTVEIEQPPAEKG